MNCLWKCLATFSVHVCQSIASWKCTWRGYNFVQASKIYLWCKCPWELAVKVMKKVTWKVKNSIENNSLQHPSLNSICYSRFIISLLNFKKRFLVMYMQKPFHFKKWSLVQYIIDVIKKMFVRITNSKNWEEACVQFPEFVKPSWLEQFLSLNFKNGVPEIFRNFCDAALENRNAVAGSVTGKNTLLVCCAF